MMVLAVMLQMLFDSALDGGTPDAATRFAPMTPETLIKIPRRSA